MADPHYASVVLLAANDNKADGTTVFADQSSAARTITSVGGASYDTASFPTGMSSAYLGDGAGDGLRCASSVDFKLATEWTAELFVSPHVLNATQDLIFLSTSDSVGIRLVNGGNIQIFWLGNLIIGVASGMSIDTWYHVAVARDAANDIRLFINGTQVGSTINNTNNPTGNTGCNIGINFLDGNSLNGWLASVRVTKGVCRYAADFATPSLPFSTSAVDVPVAAFTGAPLSGTAPLAVTFTDQSTNTPTSWLWDFGDGQTSTSQNPSHVYSAAGVYTVTLTATNAGGSDAEVKANYITTQAPAAQNNSGGYRTVPQTRRRTEDDVREAREALGIIPKRVIEEVAQEQAQSLETDQGAQEEQLRRALERRGLRMEARYQAALAERRAELIAQEIRRELQVRMQNRTVRGLLLLAAAA